MAQTYGKGLGISQSYTGKKKKDEEKKKVTYNYTPDTGKYFGVSQKSTDRKTGSGRTVSKTYNHMDMVNPSVSASQKRTQQKKEQQKFEYQSNLNRSRTTTFDDEREDKKLKTDVSLNRSKGSLNYTKKQAEKETEKTNSGFAEWRDKADKVTYKNDQERLNAIKEGRKYNTLRYDDYGLSEEKLQEFDAMFGNESTRQLAKEGAALYRSRKQTQRKVQKKEDEYRNAQLKSNQNIAFNYEKAASGVKKQIDDIRSGKKKVDNANWEIQRLNNKRADYEAKAREYKQYAEYDDAVASMVNEMYNDKDAAKYIQRGKLDDDFIGKPNWDMGGLYPGSHMFDEEDSVKLAMMQASDKESTTYQYIRGKYGDAKAQKFAEMIYEQGGLGNRYADYLGKQLDNPVYNTVQAFNAGAQNSVFGLRDAVGRVVNDEVHSEGLMNKIYQQNVESGRLNKVFGDVVYNIGNMMPAIAVSVATGGVASPAAAGVISAGVTGVSSFGNTYQQARRQGFDSESATLYAAVNGASEAALQYALTGVGAMAGGGVTKALSSAAESAIEKLCTKSVGRTILKTVIGQCINSLGEFEEEYLQEILDPVFRNWTLGEANGFEPFTEEALYAGLLGALSAGFMNSVEVAGNVYRYNKNGVPFVTSGEDMVSSGLDAPPTTEYNKMANEVDKENRDENGKIHLSKIEAGVFAQHQIDTESMLSEIEEAVDKENNSINWNGLSDRARALLVDPRNAKYFARKYGLPIRADMAPQEIANAIKRVMLDNDLANGYIPIEMDNDIDEDVKNSLTTLQNRSNLGIYVSDNLDGDDAVTIGNKIILSREAANSDVGVIKTLVHELTHSTELSQHYNKLRDAVLKILVKNKKDIDKEIDDKIDLYKANGRLLTREGALAEVVADYCGNTLFSDLNSLVEVLADNRTVGQKILQWFQNRFKESEPYSLEHKLLGQAINNFKRAFKEIDNNSTYDRLVRQDMISRPYTPDNIPSEAPDFTKFGPKVDELRKQYDDAYKEYYDFFIEHEDEITDSGNINLDTNPEYNRKIVEEFESLADKVRYLKDKLDKAIDQNNKRAVESEPEEFSDEALESFAAAQKRADEELERQIKEQEPEPEIEWDDFNEEEAKRIRDFYDNIEEASGNLTVNEDTEERQRLLDKAIEQMRAKKKKRGQASISLSKDAQNRIEEIKKRRGWTAKFIGNDLLIQDALIEMGKYTPEELREYKKKNYQRLPFNSRNGWKKLGYSVNDDIESEVFPRPIDISPGLATKIEEAVDAELEIRRLKAQKAYLEKRLNNIYDKKENVGSTVKEITKVTLGIKDQISKIEERIFDLASAYSTTKKIKGDKGEVTISVDTLGLSERHARDYFSELLSYKLKAEENKQRPRLYAELLVPDENGELSFKKTGLYASNQVVWTGQKKGATQKTYDKFQDTKNTRASDRQMWNDILDDENVTTPLLGTRKQTQRTTKETAPKSNATQTEQKIVKGKKGISNPEKAIAFTGHRNMPYNDVAKRSQLKKIIESRIKSGHDTFISGMAMGMDLIAAEEVLALKAEHPEIKLIAAIPFNGQTAKWSKEWIDRYNKVLNAADEIHIINDSYDNNAYQSRNEWMVDNSDSIVAYYDGNNNGTGNTVKYAMSKDKMVSNIFGSPATRGQASVKSKFVNSAFDKTAPNARDLVHLKKESGTTKPEDIRRSLNNLKEKAAIQLVDSLASFEGIDYKISKQLDEEISRLQQRILGIKKGLVYSEDSKAEVKKIKKQIDSVRKKQREMKYVYYAANNTRNASSAADFTIGLDTSGQGTYQADFSGHKIQRVDIDGNPMFDKNGQPLYCSNLHDIWAPVFEKAETDPDYYGDFLYYLRLLDHLDRAKIGKPTLPSEKLGIDWEYYKKTGIKKRTELIPMTEEEVNKLSKELLDKHPEFEDLALQVWQYNRNNLTYLYQSQSISENLYKKLLDQHKHYIPATRDLDIKYGDTAYDTKAIKDAKGALNLPFIPTDQAMADQTRQFYLAARRNQLMNAVADAYEANKDILGNFVMDMESAVGEDQKLIIDHELTAQELEDAFNPELDDKTNTTNKIIFYRNGIKTQMAVSDGIYKGYTSLWGGMSDFERVVGAPTRAMGTFFRNFVTNYNPVFIATNFLKDFGDAIFYSQDTTKFLKNFGKAWKQIVTNGDVWQLYKATGGFNSSFFEIGQGVNQKRNLFQRAFLDKIEKYNLFVEQAPRLAEFMTSLEIAGVLDNSGHLKSSGTDVLNVNESGFVSPGRTLDIETLRKAMYDANDITVNFGRGGILTKKINRSLVPFLNASIQGFDKVTRQFNQRGGKAWARLALKASILGVMPAVLNSLMYKDDDEWKHMTNWNKDNNYMFKLGNGKWIAIPRGRFMSFFAGLGNRAVQALNGDKVDWQSLGEVVETNIAPASVFDNNILAPIIRAVNNKNWYGKPIDSYEDLKKPAAERYDETTSEICKAIGKFLNISPKRVQDLFESYTGFIADVVVPATNLKSDTPVVDAFTQKFVKDSVYSNDYSSLFREYKDTIQEAVNYEGESEVPSILSFKLRYMNNQSNEIAKLYDAISELENSNASVEDKKDGTKALRVRINLAYQSSVNNAELLEKTIAKYYKVDPKASIKIQQRQAWSAYSKAMNELFGATEGLKAAGLSDEAMQKLVKSGVDLNDYFKYYSATHSGDKYFSTDNEGNTQTYSYAEKKQKLLNLKLDDKSLKKIYKNEFENKNTEPEKSIDYAVKHGVSAKDFIKTSAAFTEIGKSDIADEDLSKTLQKKEWLLKNIKSTKSLETLYAMNFETDKTDEKNTIAYAKAHGVSVEAIIKREIQKAGEEGDKSGETTSNLYYDNGEIVEETSDKYISGSKLVKAVHNMLNSGFTDKEIEYFYQKEYGSDDSFVWALQAGMDAKTYLKYREDTAMITADKDENGKSINGTKKQKMFDAINAMPISKQEKLLLFMRNYKLSSDQYREVCNYIDSLNLTKEEKLALAQGLGFDVQDGKVYMRKAS